MKFFQRSLIGSGTLLWNPQLERNTASVGTYVATTTSVATTGATPIGMLMEPTRTNILRNPRCEGAASPSTMPTYMGVSNGGFTYQVVGNGYENGIPYFDLSMSVTLTQCIMTNLISWFRLMISPKKHMSLFARR